MPTASHHATTTLLTTPPIAAPVPDASSTILEAARLSARVAGLGYAGNIAPQQAYELHASGEALLLDVRTEEELRVVGRVAGALHLPWLIGDRMERNPHFLENFAKLVSRDEPVLLLCRSGKRSVAAARAATEAGFSNVFNVLEGFEGDPALRRPTGWLQHGLPWLRD